MKNLRILLPGLALALLTVSGCFLISGTWLISIDLPDPSLIDSATNIVDAQIDLNTNSTYKDHKGDLKNVSDCAVLGTFTNTGAAAVDVQVCMTPDRTTHTTADSLGRDPTAITIWGPFHLGVGESRKITWDEAAKLFSKAGKDALVAQIKGDGVFTLYAVGVTAPYSFKIEKGVFVATVDAGK